MVNYFVMLRSSKVTFRSNKKYVILIVYNLTALQYDDFLRERISISS